MNPLGGDGLCAENGCIRQIGGRLVGIAASDDDTPRARSGKAVVSSQDSAARCMKHWCAGPALLFQLAGSIGSALSAVSCVFPETLLIKAYRQPRSSISNTLLVRKHAIAGSLTTSRESIIEASWSHPVTSVFA